MGDGGTASPMDPWYLSGSGISPKYGLLGFWKSEMRVRGDVDPADGTVELAEDSEPDVHSA